MTVDGGPDENPRYQKVIGFAIQHFKRHDLDALFIATNAPGRSAYNRVERRMAPLSRELAGLILPHDHFGSHLDERGITIDEQLERYNFEFAGNVLAEVWSSMEIDGYNVTAKYVEADEQDVPEFPDIKWYSEHVRESQYLLQIVKCKNTECCRPRSGLFRLLDNRFLPPPAKVKQTVDDLVLDEGGQFLDLPVNLALRLSTTLKDFFDDPADQILYKHYLKVRNGYLLVGPNKILLPTGYETYADRIKNFQIQPDDVWITGYQKSGTNWLQELVWCIGNNLHFEKTITLFQRFPTLEASMYFDTNKMDLSQLPQHLIDSFAYCDHLKSPRFIKTHLPYCLLPDEIHTKKPKMIYIARNPRDICASYFNNAKLFEFFSGDLNDIVKLFVNDKLMFAPYVKHVEEFWNASKLEPDRILFLRYENLKLHTRDVIKQVGEFMEKPLTEENIDRLEKHIDFEEMKNNLAVNRRAIKFLNVHPDSHFIRKGAINSYKNELSDESIKMLDEWVEKNIVGTELEFLIQ
ncbi:luciferin sulfotransferase-like [Chrysoperla carnea]|uniref:luciferin sulfotransferase-like n=1 Tax=Chrysoperla carnea TaxID=189513 RepID=UPI001D06D57C|nr:luciferin sulfotransferase-like [Chrysoperla carnea]